MMHNRFKVNVLFSVLRESETKSKHFLEVGAICIGQLLQQALGVI